MAQIERFDSFVAIMPGQTDQALRIVTGIVVTDQDLLWQRSQGIARAVGPGV